MDANVNWEQNAKDLAKLRDQLYVALEKANEENAYLRAFVNDVARNAPDVEPMRPALNDLQSAWAMWLAGQKAKSLLTHFNKTK
jgi:hypothetical protein